VSGSLDLESPARLFPDGTTGRSILTSLLQLAIRFHIVVAGTCSIIGAYLSIALTGRVDPLAVVALWLCAWFSYTFDRYVVHPEDRSDASEVLNLAGYVRRNRQLFAALLGAALLAQIGLVILQPRLLWGLAWGDLLGIAYVVRLPFLPSRLKTVPYLKVAYVPGAIVSTMLVLIGYPPANVAEYAIVAGVITVLSLSTLICDFKDIDADRLAGIKTIANTFDTVVVIRAVQAIAITLGLVMLSLREPNAIGVTVTLVGFAVLAEALRSRRHLPATFYFVVVDALTGMPWPFTWLVERVAAVFV